MPQANDIKELITTHARRLQELKKKQAAYGLSADPSLALEIENVEAEIQKLRKQLGTDCTDQPPYLKRGPAEAKSVLVVEDSPAWQDILREYLLDMGCMVDIAHDFAAAREKLKAGYFDLVTIDAHLDPRTRAHEGMLLLDYIRNRLGPDFPVIIVSGEINKQDLVRAFQKFSVTAVMLKENFECDEFRDVVQAALQHIP